MSNEKKERLMEWLRDAHAMEVQAEQMLKGQAGRIQHYPQFKARVEQHVEETRTQAGLLKGCIERLGGSTSSIKDIGGKLMAMAQTFSGVMVSDEIVKGMLSGYTFEHMEIASYKILIAAAEELDDYHTKEACERILAEEVAMAQWLNDHFSQVTQEYLRREAHPDGDAKR